MYKGSITWEPESCFTDTDGTINDIFEKYQELHAPKKRKCKNKSDNKKPRKTRKTASNSSPNFQKRNKSKCLLLNIYYNEFFIFH